MCRTDLQQEVPRLSTFDGSCVSVQMSPLFLKQVSFGAQKVGSYRKVAAMWYGWHIYRTDLIFVQVFTKNKIKEINTDNLRKWKINFVHISCW